MDPRDLAQSGSAFVRNSILILVLKNLNVNSEIDVGKRQKFQEDTY